MERIPLCWGRDLGGDRSECEKIPADQERTSEPDCELIKLGQTSIPKRCVAGSITTRGRR